MRSFTKRVVLQDITPLQLARLDVGDKKNWVHLKDVNIGLGAESTLKVMLSYYVKYYQEPERLFTLCYIGYSHYPCQELQRQKKIGELAVLEFKRDCIKVM